MTTGRGQTNLRPLRAFLLAPLAAPVAYWVEMLLETALDPNRTTGGLNRAMGELFFIVLASATPSYVAGVITGLPLWWIARQGRLRLWNAIAAGAFAGAVTAVIMEPGLGHDLFHVPLGPWRGALIGAVSAGVWWRLLQGRAAEPTSLHL